MLRASAVGLIAIALAFTALAFVPGASAASCTGLQSGSDCKGVCNGYYTCWGVCEDNNYYCWGVCLDSYDDCLGMFSGCFPAEDFVPKYCI